MVKNLAPSSLITWKVENAVNKLDDLAKDISRQNVEGATWLLFTAYSKMEEEGDKLKGLQLNAKEPEITRFEKNVSQSKILQDSYVKKRFQSRVHPRWDRKVLC